MTTNRPSPHDLLLPERSRLLHIGLMKTGTTSLQHAASVLRDELLERGVRYPGTGLNHRTALTAVMGRGWGWDSAPNPAAWETLRAEIDAETSRRVWVGHELVSEAEETDVEAYRDGLGDRTHVVVTLRNYAAMLPSAWQQIMKGGRHRTFESWLRGHLSAKPNLERTRLEQERLDQGAVVRRWAQVFGPENVTVVVVDKSTPNLLFEAFEDMLGLDRGFLSTAEQDGFASNRGMSAEEAELLRAINVELRDEISWPDYRRWVRTGAAGTMLAQRSPGEHDTRLVLPTWAAEKAARRAARFVEEIDTSGVRVVGDLALLNQPVPHTDEPLTEPTSVPVDAAAQAVLGAVRQAQAERERAEYYRERLRIWAESGRTYGPRVGKASGRELAVALAQRVRRRLAGAGRPSRVDDAENLGAVEQYEADALRREEESQ
ncbi:hypothetical protein GCM10009718_31040 [Isoptericola halotolerans]|uniref:Sulfotransferase family protein n=1 Tax=Isoptericola halotolerans TaxID=300560 RepID=A0ABX2A7K0_9MICO|nr:hypothetical protein [Isoptericola halotolerans]NOV97558.1 hypothetical protein [Isoptericola halotolerans]